MTKLVWGKIGKRFYETGVDRGVLYPNGGPGVAWNGIVAISEDSSGGDVSSVYYDGVKYLDIVTSEDFQASLDAYSSPPEFSECVGYKTLVPGLYVGNQPKRTFGLSYRTLIGNDVDGSDHGYKLHIVYNATAVVSGWSNRTLSGNASPDTHKWSISTVPPPADTYKPTAHLVLDSTEIDPYMLDDVEMVLYGRTGQQPRLPLPSEILLLLGSKITEPITEPI